jgi:hypothetical protein
MLILVYLVCSVHNLFPFFAFIRFDSRFAKGSLAYVLHWYFVRDLTALEPNMLELIKINPVVMFTPHKSWIRRSLVILVIKSAIIGKSFLTYAPNHFICFIVEEFLSFPPLSLSRRT